MKFWFSVLFSHRPPCSRPVATLQYTGLLSTESQVADGLRKLPIGNTRSSSFCENGVRSKSARGLKSPPTNQKAPWPTWISWATSSLTRKVYKYRLRQLFADLFPLILLNIYNKQEWRHLPIFTCDFENCIFINKASLFIHSISVICRVGPDSTIFSKEGNDCVTWFSQLHTFNNLGDLFL